MKDAGQQCCDLSCAKPSSHCLLVARHWLPRRPNSGARHTRSPIVRGAMRSIGWQIARSRPRRRSEPCICAIPIETLGEALAEGIYTGHAAMPAFELNPDQIHDLLSYLKTLE